MKNRWITEMVPVSVLFAVIALIFITVVGLSLDVGQLTSTILALITAGLIVGITALTSKSLLSSLLIAIVISMVITFWVSATDILSFYFIESLIANFVIAIIPASIIYWWRKSR